MAFKTENWFFLGKPKIDVWCSVQLSAGLLAVLLAFSFSADAQNVGVGTSNPSSKFQVHLSTAETQNALQITKDANTYLTVSNTGNLGIGVTNPTNKLELSGWLKLGDESASGTATSGAIRYHSSGKLQLHNGAAWTDIGGGGSDGDWEKQGGGNPALTDPIFHLGNVGIFVTVPDQALDVQGNVRIRGDNIYGSTNVGTRLNIITNGGFRTQIDANNDGAEKFEVQNGSGIIVFGVTENGDVMALGDGDLNGDLTLSGLAGGRTISSGDAFDIAGTSGVDLIIDSDNTSTNSKFEVKTNGALGTPVFNVDEAGNTRAFGDLTVSSLAGNGNAGIQVDNTGKFIIAGGVNGVTEVLAGAGMTGGGITSTVNLDVVADNGLTALADQIELGGTLTKATTIAHDNFTLVHDITGTGDFAIRQNGAPLFFVADKHRVGIDTETPDHLLDVNGSMSVTDTIFHNQDANTFTRFMADRWTVTVGGTQMIDVEKADNSVTINENGANNVSLRVEGDSDPSLLVTDAVNSRIGIGTSFPNYKLDVNGDINLSGKIRLSGNATANKVLKTDALGNPTWADDLVGAGMNSFSISAPLTGGTLGVVTDGDVVGITQANLSTDGYLSSTDFTTFSNKIGGSGSPTQVAFFDAARMLSSSGNLYWDNTNSRLGVGTNTPSSELTVLGDLDFSGKLRLNGQLTGLKVLKTDVTGTPFWGDDNNSGGTVTSVAVSGPLSGGPITTTGTIGINQAGTASDGYLSSGDWNTFNTKVGGSGVATRLAFWGSSSTLSSDVNLYWDNVNDRLGIGTATPSRSLEVTGDVEFDSKIFLNGLATPNKVLKTDAGGMPIWSDDNNSGGTVTSITVSGPLTGGTITTTGAIGIPQATGSTSGYLSNLDWTTFNDKLGGSGSATRVAFWTGGKTLSSDANLYFNNTSDRLGIGTSSPSGKLHIVDANSDANGSTLILGPTNQSNLRLGYNTTYSWIQSHGSQPLTINPLGNNVGIGLTNPSYALHVNGKVKSNGITESSDIRLKKNVTDIVKAIEKVLFLRGVNYVWDTKKFPTAGFDEGMQMGLIAQEVETVIPEVVETDRDGYKSIQYSHLVGLLIEAIKDQQDMIGEREREISLLKKAFFSYQTDVEKRLNLLESRNGIAPDNKVE